MLSEMAIVIAAYNEEKRLPEALENIGDYLAGSGLQAEIIVVDDGSTDATAAKVRELSAAMRGLRLISYPRNRGKGYALRQGVLSSKSNFVLVTDADLSTPIEELEKLRLQISPQSHQIAIGSRGLPSSRIIETQPCWRRWMGQTFNRLVRLLVINDFNDTQCGFKLFTGEAAKTLFGAARIDRFAYDVEILALAKAKGYLVAEVPVKWQNRANSKVRPLLDSLQMLGDLVRIRMTVAASKQVTTNLQPDADLPDQI